jgi:hypothetical protein
LKRFLFFPQQSPSGAKRQQAHILKALVTGSGLAGVHEALTAVGMATRLHGDGQVIKDMRGECALEASSVVPSLIL